MRFCVCIEYFSRYDAPKPELAEEDKVIGTYKLGVKAENVRIVSADDVFAK